MDFIGLIWSDLSALLVKPVYTKSNFSLDQVQHEPVVDASVFRGARVPHFWPPVFVSIEFMRKRLQRYEK
jgi:hypothetical protein